MLDKRYQVFVSSTFEDLQEERQQVMQALLELDCIPAGMELFPAADEDQWSLIKEVIEDSDYYIVILGGRYGSVGPKGISYTEMEYKHAAEIGKPVLAFLHKNVADLPSSKVESDPNLRSKLDTFRSLAQKKMCRFWSNAPELGGLVSRSVIRLIKHSPGIGWVRADQLFNTEGFRELVELRRRLELAEDNASEAVEGAKSVGLSRVVERQGDFGTEKDWLSILSSAVERIDLMGRTLYGWTESAEAAELIKKKVCEEHVTMRWLIMTPENEFLPFLEGSRDNFGADLRDKLSAVQKFLREIYDSIPEEHHPLLQIRYIDRLPLYFSYIRVDDRFYITQYFWSTNSGSSPMLCLTDIEAAWPRIYSREFEAIWRLSTQAD